MDDSPEPVSWQSAFFAIALVARNSMTQEGGRVCQPPPYDNGLYISRQCLKRRSIRAALQDAAVRQARDANDPLSRNSKSRLQEFATHVLLPLAAVLQLVKQMGYRGLLWTNMVNFTRRELLHFNMLRPPPSTQSLNEPKLWFGVVREKGGEKGDEIDESDFIRLPWPLKVPRWAAIAATCHFGFWIWTIVQFVGFHEHFCPNDRPFELIRLFVVFALCPLLLTALGMLFGRTDRVNIGFIVATTIVAVAIYAITSRDFLRRYNMHFCDPEYESEVSTNHEGFRIYVSWGSVTVTWCIRYVIDYTLEWGRSG
ncbi:MAG: hypothetical protein Q9159_000972 [Coniocarpon cinnabarinum]